jgi:uncharacterized membrane protein YhaH (DUF805 family)
VGGILIDFASLSKIGTAPIFLETFHSTEREYPMSALFPSTLARVPYFIRWLCFVVAVGIIAALLFSIFHRGALLAVPIITILVCVALKVGMLDIPRVRSIGWSPWVLLVFLVPLVNTIMQILLFAVPPKEK